MTWITDDASVSDSAPRDLYTFVGPNTTYRYTSHVEDVSYGGNTYTALAGLRRSELGHSSIIDPPELTVDLPVTAQVVQDHAFGRPPRSLTFTLQTYQVVSAAVLERWRGDVGPFAILGRNAKCRIPLLIGDALDVMLPGAYFQALCGVALYSTECGVVRASFDLAATVSSFTGSTLVVSTIGGNPDQWFRAGEVLRDSDGEKRNILDQTGTTLTLDEPFRTLANGNALTLYAGCAHDVQTCHEKFSAVASFRGHPYIGDKNPFITGWRSALGAI